MPVAEANANDALIEEMLNAQDAGEPGELKTKTVIDRGNVVDPPSVVSNISSAGYVWVYDNLTGEPSKCNRNMLPVQLRKKREDGTRVFTLKDPGFRPPRGTIKCLLHKDDPNAAHYREMGLKQCPAEHIPSPFELEMHMAKRHRREWAIIQRERQTRKENEDRDYQRAMLEMAQRGAALNTSLPPTPKAKMVVQPTPERPLYVSDKNRK